MEQEIDSLTEMYGWIEAGGATTGYNTFHDTQSSDVIFRTTTLSNLIAIGNSNDVTAALYVRENKVGVHRLPDAHHNYGLDVYGIQRFSNSNQYDAIAHDILACNSNINFYTHVTTDQYPTEHAINQRRETMSLNAFGEIRNRLIISDYYAMTRNSMSNIPVKGFYATSDFVTNGYKLITDARFESQFLEDEIFETKGIKFRIDTKNIDANSNLSLDIRAVLPEQSFIPFDINMDENLEVQFYKNNNVPDTQLFKQLIALEYIVENVTLLDYRVISENNIENTIIFDMVVNDNTSSMFNTGSYYHFKNVDSAESRAEDIRNIVVLSHIERNPENIHDMRAHFSHPDPTASIRQFLTPIISQFAKAQSINVYIYPLELPAFRQGRFEPSKYPCQITSTDNYIDRDHVAYTIETNDTEVIERILNTNVRNNFVENHIMIQEIESELSGIWYIESAVPETDTTCKINLRRVTLSNIDQRQSTWNTPRPIAALFFRLCEFNRIGGPQASPISYIPPTERLAVGTFEAGETLTVGGTVSLFDHLYFQNGETRRPFDINYARDGLVLGLGESETQDKYVRFSNNVSSSDDTHVHINGRVLFDSNDETHFLNTARFFHPGDKESVVCQHKGIDFMSAQNRANTSLDTFGSIMTKLVGVDDVRYRHHTLHDVLLLDVLMDQTFIIEENNRKVHHGVIFEIFADYMTEVQVHDVLHVLGAFFRVHIIEKKEACRDQLVRIYVSWYFEEERAYWFESQHGKRERSERFARQQTVDFHVFRLPSSKSNFKTCVPLDIRDVRFEKDKRDQHITLTLTCVITENIPFLCIGRFFCFKRSREAVHEHDDRALDHAVILKSIKRRGAHEFELEFRAIDNVTDLKESTEIPHHLGREQQTFLYPLQSFYQPDKGQFPEDALRKYKYPYPRITEKDVNISFSTEEDGMMYINIRNSETLEKYISGNTRFRVSAIDRVILENGIFDISRWYYFQGHVKAGIKFINNNYIVSRNHTSITYAFNGLPLRVNRANYTDTRRSAIYYMNMDVSLYYLFRLYKGHYLYIMDKHNWIWKLVDICTTQAGEYIMTLTTDHVIDETERQDLNTARHIFVIPLRYFSHHALVDDYQLSTVENYIPSRVGINTSFVTETMTVNGDVSCCDRLVLHNPDSVEPYQIRYDKDELRMNEQLLLSGEVARCKSDMVVDGVLSAREILSGSDARLKKNITHQDPDEDLRKVKALDIKKFSFILDELRNPRGASSQYGVIAQEMADVYPQSIVEKKGVIPNIFRKARVSSDARTLTIHGNNISEASWLELLRPQVGLSLVCLSDDRDTVVTVRRVDLELKAERVSITLEEKLRAFDAYFVVGTIDTVKMLHHQDLFMSGLNAIKALSREIEQIKEKTILSSTE